jgi:4-amino-4-deoxy-L-arabinose transferase-like glycosyltransferase
VANRYWLLAIPCLFQLLLTYQFGLGVDEAHYMLYSKYLDLSYFDHPPLVGWVHYFFNVAFGWNEVAARIPAILFGYLAAVLAFNYIKRKGFSDDAAFAGATALNVSFLLFALHLFLLPDTFLVSGIFFVLLFTERVAAEGKTKDWILLGITMGLLGLAKYTSVLLVIPVVMYIREKRGAHLYIEHAAYYALAIALFLISPVLVWNEVHSWISFKYQVLHVGGGSSFNPLAFFESLAGQIAGYNPLLFLFAVYAYIKCWKGRDAYRLEFYVLTTLLIFFVVASLKEPILPHWTAPFFAIALPLGVAHFPKRFLPIAAVTWLLYFVVHTELSMHWIKAATPAYRDIWGYSQLADEIMSTTTPETGIAVTNWTYASRIMYYTRGKRDVFVLDDRVDQFDIWQNGSPIGRDVLLLLFSMDNESPSRFACKTKVDKGIQRVDVGADEVYSVQFVLCKGFGL